MVDYRQLVGLRGPVTESSRGFTIELSPSWEAEKADPSFPFQPASGVKKRAGTEVWAPNDPRWKVPKPWGFISYVLKFGGLCVYCAEQIPAGTRALYSRKIQAVAHEACRAGED